MALLEPDIFRTLVRHAPLVSIDLLLRDQQARLLVGRRRNRPAGGTWFVPGGRIAKDEKLADAFARLTREELGTSMAITQGRFVGVFEHLYADNAFGEPGYGTHYIVLAYALDARSELRLPTTQHTAYRWLSDAQALADPGVHENTKAYCR